MNETLHASRGSSRCDEIHVVKACSDKMALIRNRALKEARLQREKYIQEPQAKHLANTQTKLTVRRRSEPQATLLKLTTTL